MRCDHRVLSRSQDNFLQGVHTVFLSCLLRTPILAPQIDIPWASRCGREPVCYWVSSSDKIDIHGDTEARHQATGSGTSLRKLPQDAV